MPSADALALDIGALGLAPRPALGLPTSMRASPTVGRLGLVTADVRTLAIVRRGGVSLAVAAFATLGQRFGRGLLGALSAQRAISSLALATGAHAVYALAAVVAAQLLFMCGARASLRAAPTWLPFGLWLPRITVVGAAHVAAGK